MEEKEQEQRDLGMILPMSQGRVIFPSVTMPVSCVYENFPRAGPGRGKNQDCEYPG